MSGNAATTYVLRQGFCVRCHAPRGKTHTCNPAAFTFTVKLKGWNRG